MKKLFYSLLIISIFCNFVYGFEFSELIFGVKKEIEKISKTIGISSIEKQLLKNAKYISFEGKLVAKRNSTFFPYARDSYGRTNIERMQEGLAPIGKDGLPVELHHLKQKNDGMIVELTSTEHKSYYKILHRYETTSQINRYEFDRWRRNYWKNRAKDFK